MLACINMKKKNILNIVFENQSQLWIKDENNNFLPNNPFSIKNDCLVDKNDAICDDILGKIIRGNYLVTNTKEDYSFLKKGTAYFFINENGNVRKRVYNNNILDIFNISIGNVFINNKVENTEIDRVSSILDMLSYKRENFFPNKIEKPQQFIAEFKKIISQSSILDSNRDDNSKYAGFLAKNFEAENVEKKLKNLEEEKEL